MKATLDRKQGQCHWGSWFISGIHRRKTTTYNECLQMAKQSCEVC